MRAWILIFKDIKNILSIILLILITAELARCSYETQIIPLNKLQIYSLSNQTYIIFRVKANSSLTIGAFHVSISNNNLNDASNFSFSQQNCIPEADSSNYSIKIHNARESSEASFITDASQDQCFKVELLANIEPYPKNFSIIITYKGIGFSVQLNNPINFEIETNSQMKFICDFQENRPEIVLITLRNSISSDSNLELIQDQALCIPTTNKTKFSASWLCNINKPQENIIFSIFNHGDSGSYQILISQIKPEKIDSNIEVFFSTSIPGFGNIFVVNPNHVGVLKIKTEPLSRSVPLIIASTTLVALFEDLARTQYERNIFDENGTIVIQNRQANTFWYYFISETENESLLLKSHFIKQMTLGLDTEATYYIDPEIYEYQSIVVNLGTKENIKKYEAVLTAQQANSSMNLYYDVNFQQAISLAFTNEKPHHKQAFPNLIHSRRISLSFVAGFYDLNVYLTIQVSQKGLYKLNIGKVESVGVLEMTFILTLIGFVIGYIITGLLKLYGLLKTRDDVSESRRDERINISIDLNSYSPGLGINTNQPDFTSEDNHATDINVTFILKTLEKQKDIETLIKIQQNEKNQLGVTSSLDSYGEDEICNICFVNRKTIQFKPCNHVCACAFCTLIIFQTSKKCPLCRAQILEAEETELVVLDK